MPLGLSMKPNPVAAALVSVFDKRGIVDFFRGLRDLDLAIFSSGGTARELVAHDIAATEISDYTGFPEMMGGRVKTLHPKVHGGILARRGVDDAVLKKHAITAIDLVAVNLYPFETAIAAPDCKFADAIEMIDIGGPALLRAAAKNHSDTAVVVDPDDYDLILARLRESRALDDAMRFDLAVKAFSHTAHYDGAIANYLRAAGNANANANGNAAAEMTSKRISRRP